VEIEAALDRAEELVTAIEGRSLSPRILELRGRLAAALGDTPASEQALRDALDLYREIGATGHADRLGRLGHIRSAGEQPATSWLHSARRIGVSCAGPYSRFRSG
jgi:hypothetical protein